MDYTKNPQLFDKCHLIMYFKDTSENMKKHAFI